MTAARFPFVRRLLLLCALLVSAALPAARAQIHDGIMLVKADLLADTTAIAPGKPFTVGLRLKMAPHWHTYYLYSGDAGLPTKIDWQLPAGFKAGPIQWPVPETIVSPGDIINYGYDGEVVLLTEITPPADLPPGEVTLAGKASWLVCAEICVPGNQSVSLRLPGGGEVRPANAEVIGKYRALLPKPYDAKAAGFGLKASLQGKDAVWTLTGLPAGAKAEFFPLPPDSVQVGHPEVKPVGEGDSEIRLPITDGVADAPKLEGVVAIHREGQPTVGWTVSGAGLASKNDPAAVSPENPGKTSNLVSGVLGVSGVPESSASSASSGVSEKAVPAVPPVSGSLLYFLLIGFLGGIILNIMPCVLPVISLKLFSFIKQANGDPKMVWRMGLAYSAGVFAWFLGVAALVVIFKSSGRALGNGFQLQNPWFVLGLAAVTFVFALSLLGVFEVILPGAVNNTLGGVADSRGGYLGAFLQGLLATILGTACTGPFMGPVLGFAFGVNSLAVLAVFAAIAAGMSAPFLLIAANPKWLRFLPKPGAWMERVKQVMGFVLLATVVWLLYVLGEQRGAYAVVWTGALFLVLGAACWVQGTFNTFANDDRVRWTARAAVLVLVVGGGWVCVDQLRQAELPKATGAALPPQLAGALESIRKAELPANGSTAPLSPALADALKTIHGSQPGDGETFASQLAAALKTGRPVFVDFTAAWCINCKVYEKTVLSKDPVQKALQERNAVFLKADYTNYAPDITELLGKFGRAAVPLYVLYPAGKPDAPVVLPEVITQGIVLDAFKEADRRAGVANPDVGKPIAAR